MSRLRVSVAVLAATAAAVGTTAVTAGTSEAAPRAAEAVLAGSADPFVSSARATGDVAGSTQLTIEVWLRPDEAAAEQFAAEVSTPGSALFGEYLTPDAYTARFGASRAAVTGVEVLAALGGIHGRRD